jgi:hypothetical protein
MREVGSYSLACEQGLLRRRQQCTVCLHSLAVLWGVCRLSRNVLCCHRRRELQNIGGGNEQNFRGRASRRSNVTHQLVRTMKHERKRSMIDLKLKMAVLSFADAGM